MTFKFNTRSLSPAAHEYSVCFPYPWASLISAVTGCALTLFILTSQFSFAIFLRSQYLVYLYISLFIFTAYIIFLSTRTYEESVLILRSIGIQSSSCSLVRTSTTFISHSQIKDVAIVEGYRGWSILYYLAVIYEDDNVPKMHILYESTLPRLPILKDTWIGCQDVLTLGDTYNNN